MKNTIIIRHYVFCVRNIEASYAHIIHTIYNPKGSNTTPVYNLIIGESGTPSEISRRIRTKFHRFEPEKKHEAKSEKRKKKEGRNERQVSVDAKKTRALFHADAAAVPKSEPE